MDEQNIWRLTLFDPMILKSASFQPGMIPVNLLRRQPETETEMGNVKTQQQEQTQSSLNMVSGTDNEDEDLPIFVFCCPCGLQSLADWL